MFLTISYISSASEKLSIEDIETLMMDTKLFNNQNNIKGILIYVNQTFFQVIEGEYTIIKSLFKRIEQDYRHYNVLKILEKKSTVSRYDRFSGNYITYYSEKASEELLKFLEQNCENIPDQKLHDFIVYQSKVLLNTY